MGISSISRISLIWTVKPPGNPHVQCFDHVAESFAWSLNQMGPKVYTTEGHEVRTTRDGHILVFAAHLLSKEDMRALYGREFIIFNAEQLSDEWVNLSPANTAYFNMLKIAKPIIWDYSKNNIEYLSAHGIEASHCPIGYSPTMEKIKTSINTQVQTDVLFYGSSNPRRGQIIHYLIKAGLKVECVFGVYGAELDEMIARAKVVLNMHYYATAIHEIFRTSYLLANKKCIVSEIGTDKSIEGPLSDAMAFCPYEELVAACVAAVKSDYLRTNMEIRGYEIFKSMPQTKFLRPLIEL